MVLHNITMPCTVMIIGTATPTPAPTFGFCREFDLGELGNFKAWLEFMVSRDSGIEFEFESLGFKIQGNEFGESGFMV